MTVIEEWGCAACAFRRPPQPTTWQRLRSAGAAWLRHDLRPRLDVAAFRIERRALHLQWRLRHLLAAWRRSDRHARLTAAMQTSARRALRIAVHGPGAAQVALAAAVAVVVTMASYWVESSLPAPAAAATSPATEFPRTTAKVDRLDAYARESRDTAMPASSLDQPIDWPLAERRIVTHSGIGANGERTYSVRIMVPEGTPVRAAADGVVAFAGDAEDGYGKKVIVRHGAIETTYAHASEILVKPKARVRRGQTIAKSGQTGFATAPRLYLGIVSTDPAVDPIAFFDKAGTVDRCALAHAGCGEHKPAKADGLLARLGLARLLPPRPIPAPRAEAPLH